MKYFNVTPVNMPAELLHISFIWAKSELANNTQYPKYHGVCVCVYVCISHSVVSDSLQPHGLKSPVHGVSQASTLEWVVISFSRGSFPPRERTQVSFTAGRFFTVWAIREAPKDYYYISIHHILKKKKKCVYCNQWGKKNNTYLQTYSYKMLKHCIFI